MNLVENPLLELEGSKTRKETKRRIYSNATGTAPRWTDQSGTRADILTETTATLYFTSGPTTEHVINHGIGKKNLIFSIQKDDDGEPGDYVNANSTPLDDNNLCIKTVNNVIIHVTILKG